MKMKKIVAGLLSAAMVFTSVSFSGFQMDTAKAAEPARQNLAPLTSATNQSHYENGTQFTAAKLKDGDKTSKQSRWATNRNQQNGEWVSFTWTQEQTIQEIVIYPERGGVNNSDANILGYDVIVKNSQNQTGVTVYSQRDRVPEVKEVIVLPEPVKASEVKIEIKQTRNVGWNNVSFYEVEFYTTPSIAIAAQEDFNHAQIATTNASTVEANSTGHANVIDGDIRNTRANGQLVNDARWSSRDQNNTNKQWFELNLGKAVSVKEIDLELLKRNAAPEPSNIQSFDLEFTLGNNQVKTVKHFDNTRVNNAGYKKEVKVTLDAPVVADKVKINNIVLCNNSYPNVSIVEMGVYSNDQTNAFAAYTLNVTKNVEAGGTVTTTSRQAKVPETTSNYVLGAEVELTAAPATNYKFVGWKKADKIFSANATEKVIVNGNVDVQAVFEANNRAELKTLLDEANKKVENEYTVDSWNAFNTAKTAAQGVYDNQASTYETVDTNIKAVTDAMGKLVKGYTVTVNGKAVDQYTRVPYETYATITAPTAPEGQKFAGWKLDGKIVSLSETYKFCVAGKMDFTATYVNNNQESEKQLPAALMSNIKFTKLATGKTKATFVGQLVVPEGYTMLQAGVVWMKNPAEGTTVLHGENGTVVEGARVKVMKTVNSQYQFAYSLSGLTPEMKIGAEIFGKLLNNKTGKIEWVYSSMSTVTGLQ